MYDTIIPVSIILGAMRILHFALTMRLRIKILSYKHVTIFVGDPPASIMVVIVESSRPIVSSKVNLFLIVVFAWVLDGSCADNNSNNKHITHLVRLVVGLGDRALRTDESKS